MSHANPLLPSGSSLDDRKQRKTKILVTVFGIVVLHVVPISGLLLMQGCQPDGTKITATTVSNGDPTDTVSPENGIPILDPNELYQEFSRQDSGLSVPIETEPIPNQFAGNDQTRSTELILDDPAANGSANPVGGGGGGSNNLQPTPAPELANLSIRNTAPPAQSPAPAPQYQDYRIQPGDRLYTLAQNHSTSVKSILDANPGLDPRRLRVGQNVVIPLGGAEVASPVATERPTVASASTSQPHTIYRVKRGDNLIRIARKYGVTLQALRKANNLKSDRILVDQKLVIPAAEVAAATQ